MEEAEAGVQAGGSATAGHPQATSPLTLTASNSSTTSSQSTAAATNNTTTAAAAELRGIWLGALPKVLIVLSCLEQPSTARRSSTQGLQVDVAWELYCVVVLMIVGAIALWEGVKWLLEWWWLPSAKTMAEVRREKKLKKLQLAIEEELEVQGLGTGRSRLLRRTSALWVRMQRARALGRRFGSWLKPRFQSLNKVG